MLITITTNPPITKTFIRMPGIACSTLAAPSDSILIWVIPFFSMIWDKKFDSTVKRISGINFDILQAQVLGTGAIMIILRLELWSGRRGAQFGYC